MTIEEIVEMKKKEWADNSREMGALSTAQIIEIFEEIKDKDKTVIIVMNDDRYVSDFSGDSWRGSYNLPAIWYKVFTSGSGYSVKTALENLREIDGMDVQGYKGGEYTLSKFDPLFVANYGCSNNCTAIVEIIECEDNIVCLTKTDMY